MSCFGPPTGPILKKPRSQEEPEVRRLRSKKRSVTFESGTDNTPEYQNPLQRTWLTTACDFKADELAGALPQLEAHGVTVRVDLKYLDEDVLRELQLKPLTIKKLRAGLAAMTAGAGAASAISHFFLNLNLKKNQIKIII
jgi:hypothetical protein